MVFIGIDPGKSGAITFMEDKKIVDIIRFKETEADVAWEFRDLVDKFDSDDMFACIEKVHAMPKQGVASTFKFGQYYGFARGLLYGFQVPFELVSPRTWQAYLKCLSKGDKNVTKDLAQRLFPKTKIIHATADSILIAEYCRRTKGTNIP